MSKINWKKVIGITVATAGTAFVATAIVAKKKKPDSVYDNEPSQKNPLEGKKVVFVEDENDKENADGAKGHLEAVGEAEHHPSFYEKYIKRTCDVVLSFGGLVALSPVMAAIAIAIKVEDPGPVLFVQKRMGQNKQYFKLHKFRSMKMCTPHDVPTHMLDNPDQYITKVGKFIRAHSLDELPQIWDIFIGNMSVIGPRPGLWNQDVLTAERDKYNANDVKPGLTGWAQINGRDELEIPEKARLDGEYVEKLGAKMDAKCFLGSLHVFNGDDSVVEGGTGEMKKASAPHYTDGKRDAELIGHIGFGEEVEVDREGHKKVLLTAEHSYIGNAFTTYAKERYGDNFDFDFISTRTDYWKEKDFSVYDIIYHVAGLAHADVGNVSEEVKAKYYKVNTELTVELAQKAKDDGVKEFIFMSSMIVYGDSAPYGEKKVVDEHTVPVAANFYGDSKLQADVAIRSMATDSFKVIVIRPPMIYGRGSKGNYPTLAILAKKLLAFPDVDNERSMLHIDNLCEFLCQIMLVKEIKENAVVLIPQNAEWTKTSEMVKEIAEVSGKSIKQMKIMAPAVALGGKVPGKIGGLVNKVFGNSCYAHELSVYSGIDYQTTTLHDSIEKTEGEIINISNERPLVSIVTVSFNSEKTIRKTIESVLNQTYTNIEYRIVDGMSADSTVAICREYEDAFKKKGMQFIVTSEKDKGIYDAMNKGIFDANGEIVGIINSDDWYENDAIETVVDNYLHTRFDYFYADINLVKEDGTVIVKHSRPDHIVTSRHWNHPSCFVKRKLYDELGGFKCEGIHDDFEFFLRVKKADKRVEIENKVLANFKTGGVSNDFSIKKSKKRIIDRYRCYRTNGYNRFYIFECVGIEMAKFLINSI